MGRPVHALVDAEFRERLLSSQRRERNLGSLMDVLLKRDLVPNLRTINGEELNDDWREKLLQRPPSLKPSATPECTFPCQPRLRVGGFSWGMNIGHEHVTLYRSLIPAEHRINCGTELFVGGLVNTASVHPRILDTSFCRFVYTELDFAVAALLLSDTSHQIVIRDFLVFNPCVRKYAIRRNIVIIVEGRQLEMVAIY